MEADDGALQKFSTLCEQLHRNDPSVVEAKPFDLEVMCDSPETRKRQLDQYLLALKHNTVVTTIVLHLDQFLFENEIGNETLETTVNRLQPLLYFLQHGSSLEKVVCQGPLPSTSASRMPILQLLIDALSQNSAVRIFESNILHFTPELLTSFLSRKQNLQRLAVAIDVALASDEAVDSAARAIGSLVALEDLSIETSAMGLAPFLQTLQSSSSLCRLTLAVYSEGVVLPDLGLLPSVLESSRKLTSVSFKGMYIDIEQWQLVSMGVQSNPNITSLSLEACQFSADAAELFLEDMESNDVSQQTPIRTLLMSNCNFHATILPHTRMASMLRHSQLQHISLDCNFPSPQRSNLREFFEVLSAKDSVVPLRSMELSTSRRYHGTLEHAAVFLPTTIHLRRLIIKVEPNEWDRRLDVPTTFLSGLRSNGSLRSVKILGRQVGSRAINKRAKRYIRACTRRNRILPKALPALFHDNESKARAETNATTTALPNRFPTLSVSAMQAPRMAPNNVLIGLLASVEALVPTPGQHKGKHVTTQK
jgi:hypothetical protein